MYGPQPAVAIVGVLIGLTCGLLIGTLVGAVILRAACSAFNKLSQPQNHVPEPELSKAMLISFVTTVANWILSFIIGRIVGDALEADVMPPLQIQVIALLINLPTSTFVMAGINSLMLPTTFGRGLLVALLYIAIAIAVAVVIGAIVFAVLLLVGGLN
jgi:hypothetical protein